MWCNQLPDLPRLFSLLVLLGLCFCIGSERTVIFVWSARLWLVLIQCFENLLCSYNLILKHGKGCKYCWTWADLVLSGDTQWSVLIKNTILAGATLWYWSQNNRIRPFCIGLKLYKVIQACKKIIKENSWDLMLPSALIFLVYYMIDSLNLQRLKKTTEKKNHWAWT